MSYSCYYQHFRFRVGDSLFNIDLFIECNERKLAISTKKNLFILSDVAVTYQQAEEKCQLYGGEIVQIDRNQRWSYTVLTFSIAIVFQVMIGWHLLKYYVLNNVVCKIK